MTRARKWLLGAGVGAGVLALLAALLLSLVPSDEELAGRASAELEAALGVPVHVGALHWRLRPTPTVVIEEVAPASPRRLKSKGSPPTSTPPRSGSAA
ncbi:hypothetical protein ABLV49_00370 [Polaromonas hydrogenivorans]|uniref:Uncharacterized protein n=1 Tax=Polaromonas hydrogenivorans TaxID=335476 RepID=A0AAU7LRR3_9BURK